MRGVCEKPRIKCSDCPHQAWLPVGEEVIRAHLSGADERGQSFVMGVYPMLRDERCWFLAVDFDGDTWRDDALAYMATCAHSEVPAALERSRSLASTIDSFSQMICKISISRFREPFLLFLHVAELMHSNFNRLSKWFR